MKKTKFLALFLLFSVLGVAGCTNFNSNNDIFFYQTDFSTEIEFTFNGQMTEFLYEKSDTGDIFEQITFISPAALSGFVLKRENGATSMIFGGVCVNATDEMSSILDLTSLIFSFSNDQITKITTEKSDTIGTQTKVVVGEVEIFINNTDGLPHKLCGTALNFVFEAKIKSFTPKNHEN